MLNIFELTIVGGLVPSASTGLRSLGYALFQKSGPAEQLSHSDSTRQCGSKFIGRLSDGPVHLLPLFLAAAGGAMVMSVLIEIKEALTEGRALSVQQMFLGLMTIPILNLTLGA
ncbi:MAG: hypothetical protein LW875_01270 [Proteobacteria bacterium]|jgi:hypothetical protein|nr:hypothetical protein [Pseudomonadota bacterium]